MKLSKEKMWWAAEHVLKRTEEYQSIREFGQGDNYEVCYILTKGRYQDANTVRAFAGVEEKMISFYPFKEGEPIDLWDFNFDGDLFEDLESGYELALMSLDCHCNVWYTIEAWHKGDIDHPKGMQKYLGYCKQNNITKERLQTEAGYSGMNAMALYDRTADHSKATKEPER